MKKLLAVLITGALFAQTPTGTVTVSSVITAVAGAAGDSSQFTCVGTPSVVSGNSVMHLECTLGTTKFHVSDTTLTGPGGSSITTTAQRGSNLVTIQMTKGNTGVPDGWSVVANNAPAKTGTF